MSSTRTASIHNIHDLIFTVQYGGQTQVITDEGVDPKTAEATVSVLKQVAEMMPALLEKRRVQKWDALVEALTPDVALSPTKVLEAEMKSCRNDSDIGGPGFCHRSGHCAVGQVQCEKS